MELRLQEVRARILAGEPTGNIVQFTSENWSISERQAHTYIAKARKAIRRQVRRESGTLLAENLERRRDLFREARVTGDLRLALEIIKDWDKVAGNYAPEEVEERGALDITIRYADS